MRALILFLVFTQMSYAQYIFSNTQVVLGYNRSTLSLNKSLPESFGNVNHYYNGNMFFGVYSEIIPSYHIGLQYIKRGTRETQKFEDTIQYENGFTYFDIETENVHILNYLSITGFKHFYLSDQFFFLAGIYGDIYLGGEIEVKEDGIIEEYYSESGNYYVDTYETNETIEFYDMYLKEPNPVDIGAQIGMGFNLLENVSAIAIYQHGLLETHEISYEGENYKNGWKNRSLQFQLNFDVMNMFKTYREKIYSRLLSLISILLSDATLIVFTRS